MIESVRIKHFKCFLDTTVELRGLTVLTGVAGGGKSTVLQSMLLTRQAAEEVTRKGIELNGPYRLNLGEAHELLHPGAAFPRIEMSYGGRVSGRRRQWDFAFDIPESEQSLHLTVAKRPRTSPPGIGNAANGFTYLAAERLGPRDMLTVSADDPEMIGVGVQGEYTAQVLALREMRQVSSRTSVHELLRYPETSSALLRLQTESWLSHIVRPVQITAQWAAGVMASTIRLREVGIYGAEIRPANNGFGISYSLPIIVACLIAQPGDLLLIENPEAHLHPGAQSRLGRFLARVAGIGVQVVVETHSDHVLNGARLGVAQDKSLRSDQMLVQYFGGGAVEKIAVSDGGELASWPLGFFDQIERDLGDLTRARRHT